ncbi:Regulator of protease activity HflC, stomatin/prohibitin superfamily [Zunongwangia mangrovi]|uniref:Regulator of protease activity HflC, stomatin/prohibitin superfamily n=1 Tax=Zunongwangia mangrovi TaxID=1334022 RepID=A0A1I1LRM4_9FLAO|nr:SPFH domain-containing protein [Zunongwangia mangrovi]SFC75897.1 Regulator of protease activity HflC, stomatin/prohibitin superfamily [Zunongwangia mangrovi]
MTQEKSSSPSNGYFMLFVFIVLFFGSIFGLIAFKLPWFILGIVIALFLAPGFLLVNPNESRVLLLFGDYRGTVKKNGLFWTNPFYTKKKISLRARNFDSERLKVNDKLGNPVMISTILVWRVRDTYKASFDVDNFENFVVVQTDAAVRKLASLYPYDNFADEGLDEDITLRSSMNEVSDALEKELEERLEIAGIEVLESRIGYLAYANEIASAMLKRQQATAIVAARHKIVEGAVSMVEMALDELGKKEIVHLDEERRAAMVSNLMVILCGDKDASPVVNAGTLNH